MTTFTDGPAKGTTLLLTRAPMFLRVVIDKDGRVDALDQLEDEPLADETVYLYELHGPVGWVHINRSGGRGGIHTTATYALCLNLVQGSVLNDNETFAAWCHEEWNRRHPDSPMKLSNRRNIRRIKR